MLPVTYEKITLYIISLFTGYLQAQKGGHWVNDVDKILVLKGQASSWLQNCFSVTAQ